MMLYLVILLAIGLFWVLSIRTNILRDPNSCKISEGKSTFSLGRTQLGIWTVIVFCSYVYLLGVIDPDQIKFTESVVVLLGISIGTTVVGRSMEKNPANALIKNMSDSGGCSKGFLIDILSDANGVSVHRFQQVLFTVLLIYVFIDSLVTSKNFPDLDSYLLVLSGVSSGGYLGVKMSEK